MKPINLLPKVPYIVKRRDLLVLVTVLAAILLLLSQFFLAYLWSMNRSTEEAELQSVSADVRQLWKSTTFTPISQLYEQGMSGVREARGAQPDWLSVLEPIRAALEGRGQVEQLSVTDARLLTLSAALYSEEALTACIRSLESIPFFDRMALRVAEHKQEQQGEQLSSRGNGEEVGAGQADYYTLTLEISLPPAAEIRKAGSP
ncbi:hypothetical protein [Gorillibacterium sp. CAU 1737]|uniref:hypothetical protein n=1 Tax=Gorillibacterium sp. CAU 1737 TaxID=3140362 RepID=UPI003261D298